MKVTKTYSVEKELFDLFDETTNNLNINKSSIIEEKIKEIILENVQVDTVSTWYLKNDENKALTDDPEKLNNIHKKSEKIMMEKKVELLKKKLEQYSMSFSKDEYDFDKLKFDIAQLQMILEQDMKPDFNCVHIVDKKIIDNKLYFVLSNDVVIESKEFYELFEKCVDIKEFFKPCNIYKCDVIEDKIAEIKINEMVEGNNMFQPIYVEIELNLENEIIFQKYKEYILDFKMKYNNDGLITFNKKISLYFQDSIENKYIFSMIKYNLSEIFDKLEDENYKIKGKDFLIETKIYNKDSLVYLNPIESKVLNDVILKQTTIKEKEIKEEVKWFKINKLQSMKTNQDVDLINGDMFFSNQEDVYDVMYLNKKITQIIFSGFSILDKSPIFKIIMNELGDIKLEECEIQKTWKFFDEKFKILDYKFTSKEEIK